MRTVLGILLCLILGSAQSFAISGGPNYGGAGKVVVTGIYAGVMTPGPLSPGANSLALFTVSIPKTGIGTGTVIIFAAGLTFSGDFQGIADPDSAKLSGNIDTTSTVTIGASDTGTVEVAVGKLEGRIVPNQNIYSTASARIRGESNVQFSASANNPFLQIGYVVSGFKQANL